MKVMIVVTHLLGTGHLARALTLARAFVAAGDQVNVVSGGLHVSYFDRVGVTFEQLAPLRSNGVDFTTLLDPGGAIVGPEALAARQAHLLSILRDIQPDILITELFPFGRRILRNEFTALLNAAQAMQPRPLILSSVRDVLAPPSKPRKAAFAQEMVARCYDGVFVHSDPEVVLLDHSWPVSDALATRLHYTGFVAPRPPDGVATPSDRIMVSAGGGDVGDGVFHAACDAARIMPDLHWHLLVGGDGSRRDDLAAMSPANVTVEPPRADFRQLLASAKASVSMAGYNTALDVLQTGVPAVLIPFDDGGEVEQGLRADALSRLPGIGVLRQSGLSGAALAEAVAAMIDAGRRAPRTQGMNGAATAVDIAHRLRREGP
jgi:predicted glycosyltransferase